MARTTPDDNTGLNGRHLVIGVIGARWNQDVVQRLTSGAERALQTTGANHHA